MSRQYWPQNVGCGTEWTPDISGRPGDLLRISSESAWPNFFIFGKWGITERRAMKGGEKGEGYVVKGRGLGINDRDFNLIRVNSPQLAAKGPFLIGAFDTP